MVVKYMHHGDDLVEHRTHEACFGAQCTNHSANSMCYDLHYLYEEAIFPGNHQCYCGLFYCFVHTSLTALSATK